MNCGCNNSCYDRTNQCNGEIKRRFEYCNENTCNENTCYKNTCKESNCKEDTCKEINVIDKILIVNDCTCQELMRVNDWCNCTMDKAKREFYQAEKGTKEVMDALTLGMTYSDKAKEISDYLFSYIDSVEDKKEDVKKNGCCNQSCRSTTMSYNTTCCCNPCENEMQSCNKNCGMNMKMPKQYTCKEKENPCKQMVDQYNEMADKLRHLECEALKNTQEVNEKLMEMKKMQKCMCELKSQILKNCYPQC